LKIPTSRFGTIDIPEDQVIYVPLGLIGFPNQKRYVLREHKKGSPFIWFQAVDDEDLAFVLIDPLLCEPDYEIQVNSEDRKTLELPDSCEGLQTMVIVNITPGDPVEITANLLGPVAMNFKKKLAKQVVLHQSPYTTRHPIPTLKS
jgi:flagellar assembly factor FliW